METGPGAGPDHLTHLARLIRSPERHHIFHALRVMEAAFPDRPRLGSAVRPAEDVLRIGQEAELAFPTSAIAGLALPPGLAAELAAGAGTGTGAADAGGPDDGGAGIAATLPPGTGLADLAALPLPAEPDADGEERAEVTVAPGLRAPEVWRLTNRFFGFFGPQGPLPLHLTEYARDRLRNHHDPTIVAFADMLTHRLACLFYRAYAGAQPAPSFDRAASPGTGAIVASGTGARTAHDLSGARHAHDPSGARHARDPSGARHARDPSGARHARDPSGARHARDVFGDRVAAIAGVLGPGFRNRDAMPDMARWHFAGFYGQGARHADGLMAIVSAFVRAPVSLQQFVGSWLPLEPSDRWQLGARAGLGRATSIGTRVWSRSSKFRLRIGPLSLADYTRLLPGSASLGRLDAVVRSYAGDVLEYDVNLVLRADQVPAARLGAATRLGLTSWVGDRRARGDDADELFVHPALLRGARPASPPPGPRATPRTASRTAEPGTPAPALEGTDR